MEVELGSNDSFFDDLNEVQILNLIHASSMWTVLLESPPEPALSQRTIFPETGPNWPLPPMVVTCGSPNPISE